MNRYRQRKFTIKTAFGVATAAYLLILTFYMPGWAKNGHPAHAHIIEADTTPASVKSDTVRRKVAVTRRDSLTGKDVIDSVLVTDTIRISNDSIDAPVKYHADDSGVLLVQGKQFILYGKAKTDYKDLKLEANTIQFDNQTQIVKAFGALDTTGNPLSKPQFTQGEMKTISDSIIYSMKTAKGLTKNTFLQEGEIFVNAEYLKKINADEAFARNARFTTCNLDTPHFAFRTRRMKVVNNKLAVTGRVYPEFEQVPIPIISLPFGIFPLNRARHSGVLLPAFTASDDYGLGLQGLGYYKVLGEHADLTTRVDLWSYGGWSLNMSSKYLQRYKYTGNLTINILNSIRQNNSSAIDQEYISTRTFDVSWAHNRDARARPGTSFQANVHFGGTKYNQLLPTDPVSNFTNQLSSSISYTKDWSGKYNMSINLNHNQNNQTRLINMNLPTMNFNVVTFYPFQRKEMIGTGKWYEKIGIGYSGNFLNQFSFYDSAFSFKRLLDTMQYGAQHTIPITLSLPSLGPVTVSPSISYDERWYGQQIFREWDPHAKKVDTTIQRGLYTARQMSFGVGLNTRIFGTYEFPKSKKIMAIRHEMRPTISFSYHPDFVSKYFYDTQVDTLGNKLRFSRFDGGIIGSFSEGAFGGITFGIDNTLEMKKYDSTDKKGKKVKLLDGFGFNSSYNLLADSFALANFSLYARSTLFDKVNITAAANLDPYDIDSKTGYRVNRILFDPARLKFGRITSGSIAMGTSFSSKSKNGKTDQNKQLPVDPFMTPDEQQRQLQYVRSNPAEFTDFNIPWNISISYSFNFTRVLKSDYSGFENITYSSANFNGDFSLTDKWKVGGQGYYDLSTGKVNSISMFITREMHCWQLAINVTPVGPYRSFSINLSPKSGILRDLKVNRTRTFINY